MPVACNPDLDHSSRNEELKPIKTSSALVDHDHPNFTHELDPSEFIDITDIGYGNGGLVFKTVHRPSGTVAARKVQKY